MTQPTSSAGNAKIWVLPNAESASLKAAELFAEAANAHPGAPGQSVGPTGKIFRVALAGGSTPKRTYQLLATDDRFAGIDWSKIRVFFTDERCVPPDDQQSNYRMIKEALLDHVNIPADHVHRMQGELTSVPAADLYEQVIRDEFTGDDARLDFVLLGMGADGHTASLFPNTEALEITDLSCFGNEIPQLDDERVTLTYPFLNNARQVVFLVTGKSKAETLAKILSPKAGAPPLPAQEIQPTTGTVTWLLDTEAAAHLPPDYGTVIDS